jgi:hypothetical protein
MVAGVSVLTRAIIARHRRAIAASAAGLLAIVGAAVSGASFVSAGRVGASMAMAVLTGVALLCYVGNLFVAGPPRRNCPYGARMTDPITLLHYP